MHDTEMMRRWDERDRYAREYNRSIAGVPNQCPLPMMNDILQRRRTFSGSLPGTAERRRMAEKDVYGDGDDGVSDF